MSRNIMQTPLGQVRGHGSAKDGFHHWWMQRLTAVALVPLTLWFVASLAAKAGGGHAEITAWLAKPNVAVATILMLFAMFYHAKLGVQVVVEDYVHSEARKIITLVISNFLFIGFGTASIFSVLKIAFGG